MKKKPSKRTRIPEITTESLSQLDQETLVSMVMKLYDQNKQLSEQMNVSPNERYGRKTERHEDPNQLRILSDLPKSKIRRRIDGYPETAKASAKEAPPYPQPDAVT